MTSEGILLITGGTARRRDDGVSLHIAVLPEIRKALRLRAAVEDMTMVELLHSILCRELDRADLLDQPPASAVRR